MDSKFGGRVKNFLFQKIINFCLRRAYLIYVLPFSFFALLFVRVFFFERFLITSSSMEPTIKPGDWAIVNKAILGGRIYTNYFFLENDSELNFVRLRGFRDLQHNDIVVFNYPFHGDSISLVLNNVYIKRCIGLPGDSISIVNGMYNNNNATSVGNVYSQMKLSKMKDCEIDSNVFVKKHSDPHYKWTIKNMLPVYIPRKNDIIRITSKEGYLYKYILEWEIGKKLVIDWERNIVYAGDDIVKKHMFRHNYIFVAGDNVIDSQDSRYWGVIPEDYIVGVVGTIIH